MENSNLLEDRFPLFFLFSMEFGDGEDCSSCGHGVGKYSLRENDKFFSQWTQIFILLKSSTSFFVGR